MAMLRAHRYYDNLFLSCACDALFVVSSFFFTFSGAAGMMSSRGGDRDQSTKMPRLRHSWRPRMRHVILLYPPHTAVVVDIYLSISATLWLFSRLSLSLSLGSLCLSFYVCLSFSLSTPVLRLVAYLGGLGIVTIVSPNHLDLLINKVERRLS